jgi:short-subunit dehydrogenase
MKDKVIVITGASAGIGAALAEVVARRGARPVLVARREKELREVAARCNGLPVVADVTRRDEVVRACEQAIEACEGVDVWVNNAGRGMSRMASELTDDDVDAMMLVNLKSVLYGAQAVLPHFKARGRGQIVNVSSMLGRMTLAPFRAAYSASKAAMNSFSASLRMELRAQHPGIQVTLVSPGVVATDFGLNSVHGGFDSRALPGAQSAEDVATVIADAIETPRADVYTREGGRAMVASYYAAEDMGDAETKPPFFSAPPGR